MYLIYIIIIITILILIYYFYKLSIPVSTFWITQPVSRWNIKTSKGKITDRIKKISFPMEYNLNSCSNYKDLDAITKLISENYVSHKNYHYKYNIKYFKWNLDTPSYKLIDTESIEWYIRLYIKNKLIGFIMLKPTIVNIMNEKLLIGYVDFLCIDTNYRNKKLAPVLINHITIKGIRNKIPYFIFYKNNGELPYKYIVKYNEYICDIKNDSEIISNFIQIDSNNIKQCYQYYCQKSKKYQLYNVLTFSEFIHYFINNYSYSFCQITENKVKLIILFVEIPLIIKKRKQYFLELKLLLSENSESTNIWQQIMNKLYLLKYKKLSYTNNGECYKFSKYGELLGSGYIYTYNYSTEIIEPRDNILLIY